MKISLSWLREFVELPASVPELVDLLTLAGVEVEAVHATGVSLPKVVVAQVLESNRHPNADRLSVCKVDDGSGTPRQIVCGAKNYKVGDKVPLALPGAVLPGDFKIKVGKLRGVESEGMMCSADELGLPKREDGLLILPAESPVGAPLAEIFPGDTVLEIEVTPNRPDLLSVTGIAREVAALTGKPLQTPAISRPAGVEIAGEVSIESPHCPVYTVLAINGVQAGPSPEWLRRKLESVGLRAINNIVDITNFVMLETGQPLHAFDAAKLDGAIRVRQGGEGEEFLALDGRTYRLNPEHVVIADSRRALALGGVMGGEDSGVTDQTRNILLEAAIFEPANIRRTSRTLGLSSDSSYRFERGVDAFGVRAASQRAASLILELAGGALGEFRAGGELGSVQGTGEWPVFVRTVPLRGERVSALLGTEVTSERIEEILSAFGLRKAGEGWEIPSFRPDLTREADLIEEIARVIGIDSIPARLWAAPAEPGPADEVYDFQMSLRRKLAGLGLSEARTSTLVAEAALWQGIPALRLRNPLGEDQAFLRTSLVPGLLAAVERNIRQGAKSIALYEIGRTFRAGEREESGTLAFVLSGQAGENGWRGGEARNLDWHDAKGIVEALLPVALSPCEAFAPLALAAEIHADGQLVGRMGQLSPASTRVLGARSDVLAVELDLAALQKALGPRQYQDIPKFPAVTRDLAIVAPLALPYAGIEAVLLGAGEPLLAGAEPFDVFTDASGNKLAADRKSIAISLTFRTPERTLNSEEVNTACERLKAQLKAKLAVDFRE